MTKNPFLIHLSDEEATLDFAGALVGAIPKVCIIALYGQLGAGKTTLVRGLLKSMGYEGSVKSPTYGLVETYEIHGQTIHHFDLYRLNNTKELEAIGMRDYFHEAICLVEWAEKGNNYLPKADLDCYIDMAPDGRVIRLSANTMTGKKILMDLEKHVQ